MTPLDLLAWVFIICLGLIVAGVSIGAAIGLGVAAMVRISNWLDL